ncbi:stability/partitioning determinant [Paraburkholderia sp. CNPSo 3155]|uniref:Uncharacterized protein n=1 Tax=Paraburkholderia atlantica TaxID=2654982 RepID=A0A6I1Q854_PARAM|nr:hypothetical protein [Paraburkholderia atlantica]MBB5421842.1 hypothetical protein [Paraburkholderia atlantica]MBB5429898.1 hypothetical protein [Paraburkholderia atlantica]MPW11783.1 stability/partitioning determinant [Paraburkholderia atlantica]
MSERVNPLLNLDDFATKTPEKKPKPAPEAIEKLAVENGFPSRQPGRVKEAEPARKQRRYTTGRNVQIPIKGTAETRAILDALADELHEPLGEVLARALAALRRELDAK